MAPSFLKALSRKKSQTAGENETLGTTRDSNVTQLDGNFAQVSTTQSSAPNGKASSTKQDQASVHTKDGSASGGGLTGLFRIGSRQQQPSSSSSASVLTKVEPLQKLSLRETDIQGSTPLLDVFDTKSDKQPTLDEKTIGEKTLTPSETTGLVKPCAQAITLTGLETLGIMHPHWHSASSTVQNRLISIFIQSLTPKYKGPVFDNEVTHTPTPHDVAAVLRWGIRHLKSDTISSAKKSDDSWAWYTAFAKAEKAASYPDKAFSELLLPALKSDVKELLLVTLNIISSLAAHAEHNGISGSKLSKILGYWLLTTGERVNPEKDDWKSFYSTWETAGRILEHLFLARIREEAIASRMPTRLLELVAQYPYSKSGASTDGLLARPVFTTRTVPTLYVKYTSTLSNSRSATKSKADIQTLLVSALGVDYTGKGGSSAAWEAIRAAAKSSQGSEAALATILSDESLRILKSASSKATEEKSSDKPVNASTLSKPETIPEEPSTSAPGLSRRDTVDWATFSSSGFSEPKKVAPLAAPSADSESTPNSKSRAPPSAARARKAAEERAELLDSATTSAELIQLDEAFTDFFSDAALDPVSSNWPRFVLVKLAPLPELATAAEGKPISWLVIEQVFVTPPPPAKVIPEVASPSKKGTVSKQPSLSKKRFSLFSSSSTSVNEKTAPKSPEKPAKHKLKKEHAPAKALASVGEHKEEAPKRSVEKLKKEPPPAIKEKRERASLEAAAARRASVEEPAKAVEEPVVKAAEPAPAVAATSEPVSAIAEEPEQPQAETVAEKVAETGSTPAPEAALNVTDGYKEPETSVPPPAVEQGLATTGPQVSADTTEPTIVPLPEASKVDAVEEPVELAPVPIASEAVAPAEPSH